MNDYDYIIAGGGCAGLSLAYHMNKTELKNKRILIIDREIKNKNDRTWCFWEKENSGFDEVVFRKWQKLNFHGPDFISILNFSPYEYKMIRGIDYYRFVRESILKNPNIVFVCGEIKNMYDMAGRARVEVGDLIFTAEYVFNSTMQNDELKNKKNSLSFLLQHFKGWEIETTQNVFNQDEATFMDFRTAQKGQCRFFYVLPSSTTKALVEFTVFSPEVLPGDEYDMELKNYLANFLKINDFKITHEEFGVIPMTDAVFIQNKNSGIINIGTSGGMVKASSGYAFHRIQNNSKLVVRQLIQKKKPYQVSNPINRFLLYDSILLNIMSKNLYPPSKIFSSLFKKNPTQRILSFLDEETNLWEELKIMSTTYYPPFLKSLQEIIKNKL